ncbi:ExbD/TolR family protein [Cellulophaga baltica]|uniref:Biopolymer transport protein ExbD n=1 Tax=Cellulophaga baltica TaxID=76594 RepID=A0A1G7FM04_9FLAO|nr:biopolymer transporter ExbD [Cellulophaga baltica]SDE76858.1 Biopolymer transport protein ExbD [Cellulophaga baltica]
MNNKFFLCFLILLGIKLQAQNNKPEIVLIECIYTNYSDDGIALKQLISNFENQLLEEKILADSSGSSYRRIIKQMANDTFLSNHFFSNFSDEWEKVGNSFDRLNKNCRNTILKENLLPFELKVSDLITKKNIQSSSDIAQIMLQVFSDKDLELEYIKLNLFLFMATAATTNTNGSDKLLPPIYDAEKAFQIAINSDNEIFISKHLVSISQLSELLRTYVVKNTSNSTILLNYNKNTTYGDYMKLQQVILSNIEAIKHEYALETYSLNYEALSINEKDKVDTMYPLHVIAIEIK